MYVFSHALNYLVANCVWESLGQKYFIATVMHRIYEEESDF